MIANLLPVYLAVDHINCLTRVREGDAELAALAKALTDFIVFRQRLAARIHAHEVKLARIWLVHAAVDPRDEQIAFGRDFNDREAGGVFYFIEGARRRETAFAVIHREANVGARLVAFFSRNRPNNVGAIIGAKRNLGSVLFALN